MRTKLVTATALALVLAACGGDDGGGGGDESLADFLGGGQGQDQEAMQAQFEEEQREVEEHVAACMAEQGFEYVPREASSMTSVSHPRDELDEDEFREEYGYGITTVDMSEQLAEQEAREDPNMEIQSDMDDAERQAYQEALHGEMPEPDPDADPDEPVMVEPGGCQAEAQEEVRGDQQAVQQELGDDLEQLFEQVQSDPRIVEARQGWSACMREAGWEFDEQRETFEYLNEQQQELMSDAGMGEPPEELAELEPGEEPPEDVELPEPPEPDPQALAELQEEEIELATADHECQLEHFGGQDEETLQPELFAEVMAEYERDFIDEHRDTLEELRDD